MPIEVLAFTKDDREKPVRWSIAVQDSSSFAASLPDVRPCVCIVPTPRVHTLRKFDEQIHDCGECDTTNLWRTLRGKPKFPLIPIDYSSNGKCTQSVGCILSHAEKERPGDVFFICVDPGIYDELLDNAAISPKATPNGLTQTMRRLASARSERLLGMLNDVEVDADLVQKYIGTSIPTQLVRVLIIRAAKTSVPVLVLGESGTGKEIVARAIHDRSRLTSQCVAVNCAAIPKEFLESELFGHKKGSFTGAIADRTGLWKLADRGTLFLDEIGDLSLAHQGKILRALDDQKIRPIGSNDEISVKVRIVAATNRDLAAMVHDGSFREDLYHRLRCFQIETPPLRNSRENIPVLCERFWSDITGDENARLSGGALAILTRHHWPGNVRELKGVLRRAYALFQTRDVTPEQLAMMLYMDDPNAQLCHDEAVLELERLRHLHRTTDLVDACGRTLKSIAEEDGEIAEAKASLARYVTELDVATLDPMLFGSEELLEVLCTFHEDLLRAHEGVAKDMPAETTFEHLREQSHFVKNRIRSEISRLCNL